jgi:hypothetical protein
MARSGFHREGEARMTIVDDPVRLKLRRPRPGRKIVPFQRPAPKRPPYQPSPRNGEVGVIGRPGNYAVLHYSSSGNSADLIEGFRTAIEAERAAWKRARSRQAVFIPSSTLDGEG